MIHRRALGAMLSADDTSAGSEIKMKKRIVLDKENLSIGEASHDISSPGELSVHDAIPKRFETKPSSQSHRNDGQKVDLESMESNKILNQNDISAIESFLEEESKDIELSTPSREKRFSGAWQDSSNVELMMTPPSKKSMEEESQSSLSSVSQRSVEFSVTDDLSALVLND